jgi:hypothetical protein
MALPLLDASDRSGVRCTQMRATPPAIERLLSPAVVGDLASPPHPQLGEHAAALGLADHAVIHEQSLGVAQTTRFLKPVLHGASAGGLTCEVLKQRSEVAPARLGQSIGGQPEPLQGATRADLAGERGAATTLRRESRP